MNISFDIRDAISSRRSVLSFKIQKLEDKTLNAIKSFSSSVSVPFEHNTKVNFLKAKFK